MYVRVHVSRGLSKSTSIGSTPPTSGRLYHRLHQPLLPRRQSNSCQAARIYTHSAASLAAVSKRSGVSLVTLALALGLTLGGVLLFRSPPSSRIEDPDASSGASPQHATASAEILGFAHILGMPSEIPAGRPGNLTTEQDAKLREFWQIVLKVFGVYEPPRPRAETNGTVTPQAEDGADTGKKKKSRLGLLRRSRKDKDSDADSVTSSTLTQTDLSTIGDEEDKHGQTKAFKKALADHLPEDLRKAFWSMVKHDHPDGLLLRFLRARKWVIQDALVMMVSTMHWRAEEMHVDDDIVRKGEGGAAEELQSGDASTKQEAEDFLQQFRLGKSFLHGTDKTGRPICNVRVRLHRAGEQSVTSLERYTVYTIETARMLLRPPIDTATIIFDMTDFSMANMDYTPVKFMIKCFEANYPESLGAVLVHKAPWIFQGIWNIIRGWLDPVVAGKVHFTKSLDDLAEFIPRDQIIKELGGDEDWEYKYTEPVPGENSTMADHGERDALLAARSEMVRRYEEATLEWIAAAAEERKEFLAERNKIASELSKNYWLLDPYLRARSLYDRIGLIQRDGTLQFYPPKAEPPTTENTSGEVD